MHLQVLDWCLSCTTAILSYRLLSSVLVTLEYLDLVHAHVLSDLISLPLLERETQAFMRIVLVICLILMVLDPHKIIVQGSWVEGEGNEGVYRCCLWNNLECP